MKRASDLQIFICTTQTVFLRLLPAPVQELRTPHRSELNTLRNLAFLTGASLHHSRTTPTRGSEPVQPTPLKGGIRRCTGPSAETLPPTRPQRRTA